MQNHQIIQWFGLKGTKTVISEMLLFSFPQANSATPFLSMSYSVFTRCYSQPFPIPLAKRGAAEKVGIDVQWLLRAASCFLHFSPAMWRSSSLLTCFLCPSVGNVSVPQRCLRLSMGCHFPGAHLQPHPQQCPLPCISNIVSSTSPLFLLPLTAIALSQTCLKLAFFQT